MPDRTDIDAAIEQVVKTSGDEQALEESVRELAGLIGYDLDAKTPPALAVGDRVRLLNDHPGVKAGAFGEVVGLLIEGVDVHFDGQPHPMLYGRRHLEIAVEQDDERGYETDATPQPHDGEHGTCARCGQPIEYVGEPYGAWWTHNSASADGHDAEIGGPA